jgi:hypothetical protein
MIPYKTGDWRKVNIAQKIANYEGTTGSFHPYFVNGTIVAGKLSA